MSNLSHDNVNQIAKLLHELIDRKSVIDICRRYKVPPRLIADMEHVTFSNNIQEGNNDNGTPEHDMGTDVSWDDIDKR